MISIGSFNLNNLIRLCLYLVESGFYVVLALKQYAQYLGIMDLSTTTLTFTTVTWIVTFSLPNIASARLTDTSSSCVVA